MMDLVVRAPRRPATGETLVGTSFETSLGGKGFNQAVAAARMGADAAMIGTLGSDDFGQLFVRELAEQGIDSTHVHVSHKAGTGVGLPLIDDSGNNSIVVVPLANLLLTPERVQDAAGVIEGCDVLLLQLEIPLDAAIQAARTAREAGVQVVLNPAPAVHDLEGFAGLVDYVVPNEVEAHALTSVSPSDDLRSATRHLLRLTAATAVVMTLGSQGAAVATKDDMEVLQAYDVPCIDTVGAGDAFCGALAASLAQGLDLWSAARIGNAAGARAVGRAGGFAAMPSRDDVESLLLAH